MLKGNFAVRVMSGRLGSGSAKLFFSVGVGVSGEDGSFRGALTVRDCVLREGGKGDFVAWPSKPRVKRLPNTAPAQYEQQEVDGKPQWDNLADLYFEKAPSATEKGTATAEAWELRDEVLAQAQQLYAKLSGGDAGRGAAAPPGAATSVGGTAPKSIFGDSDEAPF